MQYPSQTAEKYVLRFPAGMRDQIRARAVANRRSMNSEIVHVLDRALAAGNENGPAAVAPAPSHGPNNPSQEKADGHPIE